MPFMFERAEDYTELLMPDDLLSQTSILARLRAHIANFDEAVLSVKVLGPHRLETMNVNLTGGDPYSGVIYVFRAKRADRIKLVWWDGTGLCLMAKKLETGGFKWPGIQDGVMRLR